MPVIPVTGESMVGGSLSPGVKALSYDLTTALQPGE